MDSYVCSLGKFLVNLQEDSFGFLRFISSHFQSLFFHVLQSLFICAYSIIVVFNGIEIDIDILRCKQFEYHLQPDVVVFLKKGNFDLSHLNIPFITLTRSNIYARKFLISMMMYDFLQDLYINKYCTYLS